MYITIVEISYLLYYVLSFVNSAVGFGYSDSAMLISGYSNVAHKKLGTNLVDGIKNTSQTSWIPRSNPENVGRKFSPNGRKNVFYQYAVPATAFPNYYRGTTEKIPAVGEVQERFNAKPYFNYVSVPPNPQNVRIKNNLPPPSFSQPSFSNSGIAPSRQPSISAAGARPSKQTPSDSYNSPYTSYTPAPVVIDDSNDNVYPPLDQDKPNDNENQQLKPSDESYTGYSTADTESSDNGPYPAAVNQPPTPDVKYKRPQKEQASYGPAMLKPHYGMDDHHSEQNNYYRPTIGDDHDVILDHTPPGYDDQNNGNDDNMPDDMKHEPNFGGHPGGHPEIILDHPPPGYEEPNDYDHSPMTNQGHRPNLMPAGGGNGKPNGDMDADLNPPPPDDEEKFPNYLYDVHSSVLMGNGYESQGYDDHHVYHEVEHPTTPPPQDERVNKGHYSYYYLGRKLWYIPLYFSIYFIIYVTILILKSIARHKIQLKHEYEDHHHGREGRKLVESNDVDELNRKISTAVSNATEKYMM